MIATLAIKGYCELDFIDSYFILTNIKKGKDFENEHNMAFLKTVRYCVLEI